MSGEHFCLECDDAACLINDLNSRNGTFVNGEKVDKTVLRNGDTVVAGSTLLAVRFYTDDAAPPLSQDTEHTASAGETGLVEELETAEIAEAERLDLVRGFDKIRLSKF
jgi:pSer/pThr/pTyr-binding forkhead associated (FHA) protein